MRTLLTVVKGPRNFEDLHTINGVVHPTFRDACLAHGLLENDGEWRQCLFDASFFQVGSRLHQLFATILLFGSPSQPEILWQEYHQHVCNDLLHQLHVLGFENPTEEEAYDYGLFLLDQILLQFGQFLKGNFPSMPTPLTEWHRQTENPLISAQLDYNTMKESEMAATCEMSLNPEQQEAYDKIIHLVKNHHGSLFFFQWSWGYRKNIPL